MDYELLDESQESLTEANEPLPEVEIPFTDDLESVLRFRKTKTTLLSMTQKLKTTARTRCWKMTSNQARLCSRLT